MRGRQSTANHTSMHFEIFLVVTEISRQRLVCNFVYFEVSRKERLTGITRKTKGRCPGKSHLLEWLQVLTTIMALSYKCIL